MAKAEYRSAIRSRRLISAALVDLLLKKPLDKITVTDVVNRAEVNRGTFYAHFVDIPAVLQHLIESTFSVLREALSAQDWPLSEVPHVLLSQVQSLLEEDLPFYQKLMSSSAAGMMCDQLVSVAVDYLLQRKEDFFAGSQQEYELAIRFCAGGLSNLYRDWFAGKLDMTLDELTAQCAQMLRGVLNQSLTNPAK